MREAMHIARTYHLASERLAKLRACQSGATIAEYAIGAAMIVAAWGSVDAPQSLSGMFASQPGESCTHAMRGATPRWERPLPRCTVKRPA